MLHTYMFTYGSEVIWDLAFLVLHVDIGTMQDEKRAELGTSFLSSLVERSEVPAVGGIDWTVILDQQGSHIHMLEVEKNRNLVILTVFRNGAGLNCQICNTLAMLLCMV